MFAKTCQQRGTSCRRDRPRQPAQHAAAAELLDSITRRYGIDPQRPLLCQVSPCEPASKLSEAVDVWARVRETHPGLQMVILLMTDPQDPPARACYEDLRPRAHDEPDVFVLSMGNDVGNVELNVFQRLAAVNVQRGLRKGFGMWISDALWKRRPCVVAPDGGLTEQVIDGETGYVAETTDEFADAVGRPARRSGADRGELAEHGRQLVAREFLITRYLRDCLRMSQRPAQGVAVAGFRPHNTEVPVRLPPDHRRRAHRRDPRRSPSQLRGARVLHVNATAFGGGVAEILGTLVPLMNDIGPEGRLAGDPRRRRLLQRHQGRCTTACRAMYYDWTPEMREIWLRYNELERRPASTRQYDFVVIHDPQPAAILDVHRASASATRPTASGSGAATSTSPTRRCRSGTSCARTSSSYDARDLHDAPVRARTTCDGPQICSAPPASTRSARRTSTLPIRYVNEILQAVRRRPRAPDDVPDLRFDPWKDPLGVIDVYRDREARSSRAAARADRARWPPTTPRAGTGTSARSRRAGEDLDIHLLSNLNGVGNVEINAFQRAAEVVIQKSLREGFGLVVRRRSGRAGRSSPGTSAASRCRSLYGKIGFLVNTTEECIEKLLYLLQQPEEADRMGANGRRVRARQFPHDALPSRLSADILSADGTTTSQPARHRAPLPGGAGRTLGAEDIR